ncbi:GNAT family N-acetyltransferase [Noviherbaspirillum saxi]|uniref:GNAT family N-acetyltransferase n=2 Tax=Noviherbaspirillum saxi TaxID=2320863 RepID=A0A3A3FUZ0_9BURK|nr:GNAT family N-acetyltransferase [Noviherbaspirillum saxi]
MTGKNISIACYDNEVPPFVEAEMDSLYGNIFSSLVEFRVYGWVMGTTSTYVVHADGQIITLLLFKREQGMVRVLNETICVGSADMQRFADFIFKRYRDVQAISFKAIETDIGNVDFPYQRFNHLEDITLSLPSSAEAYLAGLGKNTRRNIKRYTDRLIRTFPSCRFEVFEGAGIREEHVRTLIEFNRERMADKNIVSVIDEEETRRIICLVRSCGLVGIVTIDGRIAAGALSYRAGSNYFLNVLAHAPCYDEYWLGFLCCYRTICECIARRGREFHFLWGRYEYKFALGAVQRDLDNVTVYRSWVQVVRHVNLAWHEARQGYARQAKVWLKYSNTGTSRRMLRLVGHIRDAKRAMQHVTRGRKSAMLQSTSDH